MKKSMIRNLWGLVVLLSLSMCFSSCEGLGEWSRPLPDPIPVTSISLNETNLSLNVADADGALTATVEPKNADYDKIIWSSSDESIATVDETGIIHAVAEGNVTITAQAGDKKATCDVQVTDNYSITQYKKASFDGSKVVFEKKSAASVTKIDNSFSGDITSGWYSVTGSNVLIGAHNGHQYLGGSCGSTDYAFGVSYATTTGRSARRQSIRKGRKESRHVGIVRTTYLSHGMRRLDTLLYHDIRSRLDSQSTGYVCGLFQTMQKSVFVMSDTHQQYHAVLIYQPTVTPIPRRGRGNKTICLGIFSCAVAEYHHGMGGITGPDSVVPRCGDHRQSANAWDCITNIKISVTTIHRSPGMGRHTEQSIGQIFSECVYQCVCSALKGTECPHRKMRKDRIRRSYPCDFQLFK